MNKERWWRHVVLSCLLVLAHAAQAEPPRELEGITIDDTAQVAGAKLVLNGASIQKRGFFKTNTCALYLTEKRHTLDEVVKLAGPKRVHLVMLRDVKGFLIARQFLNDFAASASESEAQALTTEVESIAAGYAKIDMLRKGDVVLIDWIPGEGIAASLNGQSMGPAHDNELLWDVSLRPVMGPLAPRELREQLLDVN
ncbi:MAG: chalcone isomerase family protein [Aquabacterium sp.]|uniref:chalcone isomerase family protein n=1 Tax=Aquabacterium sp. TaxID=1872578 RepID=UPI0027240F94|nr:chalcone isomerase family protein [Aquabacterium sp.]MDO9004030.1 chalcone isomerase family protein [Aquabacterium sp.]